MSKVLDYTRKATWALGVSKKYKYHFIVNILYNYISYNYTILIDNQECVNSIMFRKK